MQAGRTNIHTAWHDLELDMETISGELYCGMDCNTDIFLPRLTSFDDVRTHMTTDYINAKQFLVLQEEDEAHRQAHNEHCRLERLEDTFSLLASRQQAQTFHDGESALCPMIRLLERVCLSDSVLSWS